MTFKGVVLLLVLYSAFQALILAAVFLIKKGNKRANRLFALFMLLFSFHLLFNYLQWSGFTARPFFVHLLDFKPATWLLYGPVLFLYFKSILKDKALSFRTLWHLVPLGFYYLVISKCLLISEAEKIRIIQQDDYKACYPKYSIFIVLCTLIFYLFKLNYTLFKGSNLSQNMRTWANWIFYSFASYVVALSLLFTGVYLKYFSINSENEYIIGFLLMTPIWAVTYFAYIQPEIFSGDRVLYNFQFNKYKKSGLTESHSRELKEHLLKLLEEKKVYKQSDLSLELLSEKLDTSRHNTSQIINEHFNLNFFELLNKYRIKEAQRLFSEDTKESLTVLDVALEVGYNNRVTFNKIFKRETGHTPSEYRKTICTPC